MRTYINLSTLLLASMAIVGCQENGKSTNSSSSTLPTSAVQQPPVAEPSTTPASATGVTQPQPKPSTTTKNAGDVRISPLVIDSYSKDFQVSPQEAERRLRIQSQLPYIVKKLNEQFGDTISGVYFDSTNDFKLVVRTTKGEDVKKQVVDLSSRLSQQYALPVEVITNSPRNMTAIRNVIKNQKQKLAKEYSSFQAIAYNPQKNALVLSFFEPDLSKQEEIKEKLQKLDGMDTIIEFISKPITSASDAPTPIGGGSFIYSSGVGSCTAGFTGSMNGQLGVLTATHCVNNAISTYYNNSSSFTYFDALDPYTPASADHEISFLPLNTATLSGFVQQSNQQSSSPNDLPITGTAYAQASDDYTTGSYLCHTGQTTGFSCGTVTTLAAGIGGGGCNSSVLQLIPQTSCNATYIGVSGENFQINKGDSGGPLFDSTGLAYGIASYMGNPNTGYFSSLAYLSDFTIQTES